MVGKHNKGGNKMSNQIIEQTKKQNFSTREICYIGGMAALLGVTSWIIVPTLVPFTLQTMGVFLALLVFGGKLGGLSILTYLLLGAMGAPVFAGMKGGFGVLMGPTGGYLFGFLVQALVYHFIVKDPLKQPFRDIFALLLGQILCYALGSLQFMLIYSKNVEPIGFTATLGLCVFPYILPDLVKLFIALPLAKRLRPLVKI